MGLRVLLVEDDDQVRGAYAKLLKRAGYDVMEAATFETAAILLNGLPFEVVVLDRDVAGKDGWTLADRARGARVVKMSGDDISGEDYFQKPGESKELLARVVGER